MSPMVETHRGAIWTVVTDGKLVILVGRGGVDGPELVRSEMDAASARYLSQLLMKMATLVGGP